MSKMDQKLDQVLVLLHTLTKKRQIVNQESREDEVWRHDAIVHVTTFIVA